MKLFIIFTLSLVFDKSLGIIKLVVRILQPVERIRIWRQLRYRSDSPPRGAIIRVEALAAIITRGPKIPALVANNWTWSFPKTLTDNHPLNPPIHSNKEQGNIKHPKQYLWRQLIQNSLRI